MQTESYATVRFTIEVSTGTTTPLPSSINVANDLEFMSPVPLPPALYLFGSGLIGLVGMARRKPLPKRGRVSDQALARLSGLVLLLR